MREQYYTGASIDDQARVFLKKIMPLRTRHETKIHPKKAMLLIIDCQKFFFNDESHAFIPSAPAIIPNILKLHEYCLERKMIVIATRHANVNATADFYHMKKWWGDSIVLETDPLSRLIPEIGSLNTPIVTKGKYDALYDAPINSIAESGGIKQIIIAGVMTHLCCETTARAAFAKGYDVFFTIDGTATYNQEFHLGSLMNLAHGFAVPMLTSEICESIRT